MRSTRNAAKDTMEVLMICNLLAKIGMEVTDKASAEAALAFGARVSSYALGKDVTPAQWRRKLDRVMKIYRDNPEAAGMMADLSAALMKQSFK